MNFHVHRGYAYKLIASLRVELEPDVAYAGNIAMVLMFNPIVWEIRGWKRFIRFSLVYMKLVFNFSFSSIAAPYCCCGHVDHDTGKLAW